MVEVEVVVAMELHYHRSMKLHMMEHKLQDRKRHMDLHFSCEYLNKRKRHIIFSRYMQYSHRTNFYYNQLVSDLSKRNCPYIYGNV